MKKMFIDIVEQFRFSNSTIKRIRKIDGRIRLLAGKFRSFLIIGLVSKLRRSRRTAILSSYQSLVVWRD